MADRRFPIVQVSEEVDRLIEAATQAAMTLGAVDANDRAAVEEAYDHLSMARKALYEHVESLESNSKFRINRTVQRRFD